MGDLDEAKRRYYRSAKGKAAKRRYDTSEKGKAAKSKYKTSAKGRMAAKRYSVSDKGQATYARYAARRKLENSRGQSENEILSPRTYQLCELAFVNHCGNGRPE